MDLVIAEKPSVARDIAKVLGASSKGNGYVEGNNYTVTWCIGHLIELEEPGAYDPSWRGWSLRSLPMLPEIIRLKPTEETIDQWRVVRSLLRNNSFNRVINACDAGREGELIFRYAYDLSGSKLPIYRLWVSSLTDSAIRDGFAKIQPGSRYENLAEAARCRSEADWLVGMNITRATTLKNRSGDGKDVWSVGRVQTPTLAVVVERDITIRDFKPEKYWEVAGTFFTGKSDENFTSRWFLGEQTRISNGETANEIVSRCKPAKAVVEKVEGKRQKIPPPLLFDLTTLQRVANTRWGWSAQKTLTVAQALYEKSKAITYPRTDSQHLSPDITGEFPGILDTLGYLDDYQRIVQGARNGKTPGKRFIDASKVSDHHAIIPTSRLPQSPSEDEILLYDAISRRFMSIFYPDAEFDQTLVVVRVGEGRGAGHSDKNTLVESLPSPPDRYFASGRMRVVAGWQSVTEDDDSKQGDGLSIPPLKEGDVLRGVYKSEKKETKPPRRYTEATLLAAMESAGKELDDEELRSAMKDSGLGTPATRASIIETLIKRGYLARDKKNILSTPKGEGLVTGLPIDALTSAELTGQWEARLSRIARGEEGRRAFMLDIRRFVSRSVQTMKRGGAIQVRQEEIKPSEKKTETPKRSGKRPEPGTELGIKCPSCKTGNIIAGKSAWGCTGWKDGCRVKVDIEKNGKVLTRSQVKEEMKAVSE